MVDISSNRNSSWGISFHFCSKSLDSRSTYPMRPRAAWPSFTWQFKSWKITVHLRMAPANHERDILRLPNTCNLLSCLGWVVVARRTLLVSRLTVVALGEDRSPPCDILSRHFRLRAFFRNRLQLPVKHSILFPKDDSVVNLSDSTSTVHGA